MQPDSSAKTPFNRCIEYFIDSLMGRAQSTRQAYYRDLLQFKLYLVLQRPDCVVRGSPERVQILQDELDRAGGRLIDTRFNRQQSRTELRPRAILDEFDCDLAQVNRDIIVGYFGYLETARGVGRNTLYRRASSLRRFFRLLAKDGFEIDSGALEKLDDLDIRPERVLPVVLTQEEVIHFMQVIDRIRDRAIVLVMLYMGLRIAELVRLNVDDIAQETTGITFLGKGSKERYVPVHPTVRDAVVQYKDTDRRPAKKDALGDPLFVSQQGNRMDPSTVRRMIDKYAQRAVRVDARKRPRLSPHKFRHTFATLLLQGDVDIRHIQELLGHEHLSTTQIYTSVVKRDLHRAIERHPLGPLDQPEDDL